MFRYTWVSFGRELFLLLVAALFCIPLYIAIVLSLKSNSDVYASPLSIPTDPQWSNFSTAMKGTATASMS
ncbi:MAG: hypothetical protein ABUL47_02825, partial [Leifsonia sp.]